MQKEMFQGGGESWMLQSRLQNTGDWRTPTETIWDRHRGLQCLSISMLENCVRYTMDVL